MRLNRCVLCMPMSSVEFAKRPCDHRSIQKQAPKSSTVDAVLNLVQAKAELRRQRRPELSTAAARSEVWHAEPQLLTAYRTAVRESRRRG